MVQARRVCTGAVLLLPGGLVIFLAFNSGGFYPGATAYAAVILCVLLLARMALAGAPFAGISWQLAFASAAFLAFALLTLASGNWSHAPGVARVEFDRPLLYLLAMVMFGSIGRSRARLRWMLRGLAAASVTVCVCGLVTRLLPDLWPISPEVADNRLGFPVTYWNVLGLLAAIGIVLCVHITTDLRESRAGRALAAACVPLLADTLYFTFSRGAIGACVLALLVYFLAGRPRTLLSSLLAMVAPTVVALIVAYDANLLATANPTTAAATAQGHRVAVVAALCAVAAALARVALVALDPRLTALRAPAFVRRLRGWRSLVLVAAVAIATVAVLQGAAARDVHRFVQPTRAGPSDFRARLTDPGNAARIAYWRVAWHEFTQAPVLGHGAGTYSDSWARRRNDDQTVKDAHSLYLETLDEVGIVGLGMLLIAIATILVRVGARLRSSARPLYAAVLAVLVAIAVHAGVDWDWEMPVVMVIFFCLGGFVLGRRVRMPDAAPAGTPAHEVRGRGTLLARVAVVCALVPLAVLPAYVWLSQRKLDSAAYAFANGDCSAARRLALSSISILGNRADAYEIVSYCSLRMGMPGAALAAIEKAVSLDPDNWNYRYGVALMRAAAGLNPRGASATALVLNPREPLVRAQWRIFQSGTPAQWKARARAIAGELTTL